MTTIHDIARKSGYSAATVSRVLNGKKHVSLETKKIIQQVIDELDYVPSDIARDLSRGKTLNIGFVLPNTKHPFFTEILTGAIDAAFKTAYHLVILPSEYDEKKEIEYLEQLKSRAYDGLIFTSHGMPLSKLAEYNKYGPIICCEDPYDVPISAVYAKRRPALKDAFVWIKDKRYTKIGFFLSRGEKLSATSRETLGAYQTIFKEKPKSELIKTGVTTYQDGYEAARQWVEKGVEIEVIFSNGDDIVTGARQYYLDHQLPIPFLVGQEDQLSSQLLNISTIDYQFTEIGKQAFNLVIESTGIKKIGIQSTFILR